MFGTNRGVEYPKGADLAMLKRFEKRLAADRLKAAKADHAAFQNRLRTGLDASRVLGKSLGLNPKALEREARDVRKAQQARFGRLKAPRIKPLTAHNPTRYAPFDMAWSTASGGGIVATTPYGPEAPFGRTGYSIGVFNGGSYSTVSSVGFWYFAGSTGSLHVTLEANVWGRGFIYSLLFGYADAYAGLRVFIERYNSVPASWSATTTLYQNSGVVGIDLRETNWERRSVTLTVPVTRNTWYAIWGDTVQWAGAGGIADALSNYQVYMGPVTHWVD